MTSPDGRYSYNSPPNWPNPPQNWTPAAGWTPDPTWPPAPEGWSFWLPRESPPVESSPTIMTPPVDVYTDPDQRDLRPSPNLTLPMARGRHREVREAGGPEMPASPTATTPRSTALQPHQAALDLPTPTPVLPADLQPHVAPSPFPASTLALTGTVRRPEGTSADLRPSSVQLAADRLPAEKKRKSFAERRAEKGAARNLKEVAKQAEKQAAAALQAQHELRVQRVSLQKQLDFVAGWPGNAPASTGLVLKKGEHMVGTVVSAGLVEVRRAQGHVVGGSSGVSVRVAKGVRLRAGGMRGHYVPGDEQETQLDTGSATITNQRIVFAGSRQTREWKFENLAGRQLTGNRKMSWLELPVSNRQKMSALSFPKDQAAAVVSAVELALLFHQDNQGPLIEKLRQQIADLDAAGVAVDPPA